MPSATDVNLGYGFISPIYCSKAKKVILFYYKVFFFRNSGCFWKLEFFACLFGKILVLKNYQMLKDRENSVKVFRKVSNSQK